MCCNSRKKRFTCRWQCTVHVRTYLLLLKSIKVRVLDKTCIFSMYNCIIVGSVLFRQKRKKSLLYILKCPLRAKGGAKDLTF